MPSARGFGSSAQRQIGPQMNSVAKSTGSRFGKVFAYSSMSPLKAIGAAAFGLFAIQKVKQFFSGAIDEARESQKVSALTAQVIKSTGGAAGISAKQVGQLAGNISLLTGIDDEAIQGAENLLLTFTNLRNEAGKGNDVFNQATRIVTDMSTALDQDLKSSSIQVGKALNDPVKGITALSRVGVSFTEQQKKQIETLVKSGKTLDAQKIILGELNREFGGAAAAAATSGDKFKTAFANLQEQIGLALLPYLDKLLDRGTVLIGFLMNQVPAGLAAFKSAIAPVSDALGSLISNHLEAFHTILAALAGGAIASVVALIGGGLVAALVALVSVLASPVVLIGALAGAAVYAYMKFESFRALVQQVIAWFQSSFVPALMQAVGAVQTFALQLYARLLPLLPQVQQIFGQIVSTVKSYLALAAAEIKIAVAVIQFVWSHFSGQMLDYAVATFKNILTAIKGALNVIQGVIRLVTAILKGDWSGAWDAIKQITKGVLQIVLAVVRQSFAQLQAVFGVIKTALPIIAAKAWDLVKAAFVAGVKLSVRAAANLPDLAVAAIRKGVVLLVGAGKDLIQGLVNGIKNAGHLVIEGIGSVVDAAIAWAKKKLHIGSPSKVFHEIGEWTMEGLRDGIKAGSSKVLDAAKSVVDSLRNQFASIKGGVASNLTGDLFGFDNAHDFLVNLVSTKGTLQKVGEAFKKLLGWGVAPQFLSALFQNGGGGLILDLASGDRISALTAASVFSDVNSLSSQLGGQVASTDIGPELRSQTRELREIKAAIKRIGKDVGHEINGAVSHGHRRAS